MIDARTLQRLQARDATVFRMRIPAYARNDGFHVAEHCAEFVSRVDACRHAFAMEMNAPIEMPTPIIEPIKARKL